jgi:secreted PhoX family phosphatase
MTKAFSRRNFMVGGACALGASLAFERVFSMGHVFKIRQNFKKNLITSEEMAIHKEFTYKTIQRTGDLMSDGYKVPGDPDGMAVFPLPQGGYALMRNHELNADEWYEGPGEIQDKSLMWDKKFPGGVSRLVFDENHNLVSSNLSLVGTAVNCSGGTSPWGWMTCEETFSPGHGYVFLVNPYADQLTKPQPIMSYGQMVHEACVVDPETYVAYLTEDHYDSCFYRFVPFSKDSPFEGELQALKPKNSEVNTDTGSSLTQGQVIPCEWIVLEMTDQEEERLFEQALRKGAFKFLRGEGLSLLNGQVFFTATQGGVDHNGQIFSYSPINDHEGELKLVAQNSREPNLKMPDNLFMTPWGDLYYCEDCEGHCSVMVLKSSGELITLCTFLRSTSEFTGVCFSPDYAKLYVNVQRDGLTLCLSGDFRNIT